MRLRGRNVDTREKKGLTTASERFDYWYGESEFEDLVPSINALADKAEQVRVIFNTNRADQGQRGAAMLQKMISVQGLGRATPA